MDNDDSGVHKYIRFISRQMDGWKDGEACMHTCTTSIFVFNRVWILASHIFTSKIQHEADEFVTTIDSKL